MDCLLTGYKFPGSNIESTPWSSIPTDQSLLYAFPESDEARLNQDLGLDGVNDPDEAIKYGTVFGT